MKYRPSNFSKVELDHNTNPDPFQHVLPNEKTTFREMSALDHEDVSGNMMKPEFAYKGTNKGVAH
jgi:hypothetical protein